MRFHGECEVFQGYIIGFEDGILREGIIRKWEHLSRLTNKQTVAEKLTFITRLSAFRCRFKTVYKAIFIY